jgi:hypothetical protein
MNALRRSVVTEQPKDAKFEQLFDKNKTVTIIVTKRNEVFPTSGSNLCQQIAGLQ